MAEADPEAFLLQDFVTSNATTEPMSHTRPEAQLSLTDSLPNNVDANEPLLKENKDRFVIFPIQRLSRETTQ